jgi:hypothetical protein
VAIRTPPTANDHLEAGPLLRREPAKSGLHAAPIQRAPITDDELKQLLATKVVRGTRVPPGADARRVLLQRLNRYGRLTDIAETRILALTAANQLRDSIRTNAEALAHNLREFVTRAAGPGMWPALAQATGPHERNMNDLLAFAAEADRLSVVLELQPYAKATKASKLWHKFAHSLANDFDAAMRSTNPTTRLGRSCDGPVVRFLEILIPRITGEHPISKAIVQRLRLHTGKTAKNLAERI